MFTEIIDKQPDDPRTTCGKDDWDPIYLRACPSGCPCESIGCFGCCVAPGLPICPCICVCDGDKEKTSYWCWGLPLACGISKGVKHDDGAIVFRNVVGGVLCLGPVLGLWWKGEACYMARKTTTEETTAETA